MRFPYAPQPPPPLGYPSYAFHNTSILAFNDAPATGAFTAQRKGRGQSPALPICFVSLRYSRLRASR